MQLTLLVRAEIIEEHLKEQYGEIRIQEAAMLQDDDGLRAMAVVIECSDAVGQQLAAESGMSGEVN